MSKNILVAYASRTGSTVGIAQTIGFALTEKGAVVDILPMVEVRNLEPYQFVVAGSAIQNRQWLPEAIQFIQTNEKDLIHIPCAIFLVCMTLAMRNETDYRPFVSEFNTPVRARIRPVCEGLFAGALEIRKIPSFSDRIKFQLSVALGIWSEGDHRDWKAIKDWADALPFGLE